MNILRNEGSGIYEPVLCRLKRIGCLTVIPDFPVVHGDAIIKLGSRRAAVQRIHFAPEYVAGFDQVIALNVIPFLEAHMFFHRQLQIRDDSPEVSTPEAYLSKISGLHMPSKPLEPLII